MEGLADVCRLNPRCSCAPSRCLFLTHDVDGVRVFGPTEELKDFMKYVVNISGMLDIGSGYEHLGGEKHRDIGGWWTRSSPKYLKGAMEAQDSRRRDSRQ